MVGYFSKQFTQSEAAELIVAASGDVWSAYKAMSPFEHKPNEVPHYLNIKGHTRRLPDFSGFETALKEHFATQRNLELRGLKNLDWSTKLVVPDGFVVNTSLMATAMPYLETFYKQGLEEFQAKLPKSTPINAIRINDAVQQLALRLSNSTNQTTTMELNTALSKLKDNIALGLTGPDATPENLTRLVAEVFDRAETYRARQIALTESSRALHSAQLTIAKESGFVVKKKWLLGNNPCSVCVDIADSTGEGIDLQKAFA